MTSERPVAATTAKRGNRYGGASPRFCYSVHVRMNAALVWRAPRRVFSRRAWASPTAEALVARLSVIGEIFDVVLTGG